MASAKSEPAQRYTLYLRRITGMVLVGKIARGNLAGTFEELTAAYREVQEHNAVLGWWSLGTLFVTPYFLLRNAFAYRRLKRFVTEVEARMTPPKTKLPKASTPEYEHFAKDFWNLATESMQDVAVHCFDLAKLRKEGKRDDDIAQFIGRTLGAQRPYSSGNLDPRHSLLPLYAELTKHQAHGEFVKGLFEGAYNANASPETAEALWRQLLELFVDEPKFYRVVVMETVLDNGLLALGQDVAIVLETHSWD